MTHTKRNNRRYPLLLGSLLMTTAMACGGTADAPMPETEEARPPETPHASGQDKLLVAGGGIWGRTIPVCWNIGSTQLNPAKRDVLRRAVRESWERVSQVRFVGWKDCPELKPYADRLVIHTRPGRSRSSIGKGSDNYVGIDLDSSALEATTIHEFGHALGFYHEQARADTPATGPNACNDNGDNDLRSNPAGAIPIDAYDSESIMNYCNPHWFRPQLSMSDIRGVRRFYGNNFQAVGGLGVSSGLPTTSLPANLNSMDIVVLDADATVWHKNILTSAGVWSAWEPLYGPAMAFEPAVLTRPDGTVYIFATGRDGHLWQQTRTNGRWEGWYSHGGNLTSGPAVTTFGTDLYVFARDNTGQLAQRTFWGGQWKPWYTHTGAIAGAPSAVTWPDQSLFVFARSTSDTLVQKSYRSGSWGGWYDHGGAMGGPLTSDPGATTWGMGTLYVFARGPKDAVQNKAFMNGAWQTWNTPTSSVSPGLGTTVWLYTMESWQKLPGTVASKPAAITFGPDRTYVFATDPERRVRQISKVNGSWDYAWYVHPI